MFKDQLCKRGFLATGLAHLRRGIVATLIVIAVLYGSLIPFRLDARRLIDGSAGQLRLELRDTTPEDVGVNVLIYAAVAAALFSLARRRGLAEGIGVVLLCAMLSFVAESVQTLIPQRVSSATDLSLNVAGAILGVAACALLWTFRQRLFRQVVSELSRRPMNFWAIALSSALLAYHLVPFDFVMNTDQLHDSFRRIHLFDGPAGWIDLIAELIAGSWFAVVAFLITRDARENDIPPLQSMMGGLRHGVILACLIECLQLFTHSHVPEVVTAVVRSTGALVGSLSGAFFVGSGHGVNRRIFSASTLFVAAMFQFVVFTLTIVGNRAPSSGAHPTVQWCLPFKSMWLQPAPAAAASAVSTLVIALLLTVTLMAALRQARAPFYRPLTCLIVIGFYAIAQVLRVLWMNTPFDPTDTILAALACGVALGIARWIDTYAAAPLFARTSRPR